MRTTIDLPDDLYRRAKATAALRGMKLKDLVAEMIERGLSSPVTDRMAVRARRSRPLPRTVLSERMGKEVPLLSNDELERIQIEGEVKRNLD